MHNLVSDWQRIGKSGPTIDDREIKPEWLTEAAETYDPEKKYTALIFWEHRRFFGNFGKIVALKTEKEPDGEVGLYARIAPNARLIDLNKEGQSIFTSMELRPNFAKSGKHYLSGMAITDEPASLATTELRFSKASESDQYFTAKDQQALDLSDVRPEEIPSGWLQKIASHFNLHPNDSQQDDDAMNDEQFKELKDLIEKNNKEFSARLDALEATDNPGAESKDEDGATDGAPNDSGVSEFSAQIASLTSAVKTMTKQFNAMLDDESGSTKTPEHDGDAGVTPLV